MAPAPRKLAHAVRGHLQAQCIEVLKLAAKKDGRFSINDPAFDRLHVAVYQLYLLGLITRAEQGFEEWAMTDAGRREMSTWEAGLKPAPLKTT
jgi:hypothetical protein